MNYFQPLLSENPYGSDPLDSVYIALNRSYPQWGLTKGNSKIVSIQAAATKEDPYFTRMVIEKDNDINQQYELFYSRNSDVNRLLPSVVFNPEDIEAIQSLTNSEELVAYIAKKYQINFKTADFWTEPHSIEYCGGSTPPNWLMKAMHNSIHFAGERIIPLHD